MTLDEAINYFGSCRKVCRALGLIPQNFTYWRSKGSIPQKQQMRLEILTEGKLKADIDEFIQLRVKETVRVKEYFNKHGVRIKNDI